MDIEELRIEEMREEAQRRIDVVWKRVIAANILFCCSIVLIAFAWLISWLVFHSENRCPVYPPHPDFIIEQDLSKPYPMCCQTIKPKAKKHWGGRPHFEFIRFDYEDLRLMISSFNIVENCK